MNDPPRQFIDEMCERGDFKTPRKELYEAYARWCRVYGHRPKAVSQIKEDWLRLGLVEGATKGKRYYKGVKIAEDPDDYFGYDRGVF